MKRVPLLLLVSALAFLSAARAQDGDPGDRWNPCWGSDRPCGDGKYRGYDGREQPATCSNDRDTPDDKKCRCPKSMMDRDACPPGEPKPDKTCSTSCRSAACGCVTVCDMNPGGEK